MASCSSIFGSGLLLTPALPSLEEGVSTWTQAVVSPRSSFKDFLFYLNAKGYFPIQDLFSCCSLLANLDAFLVTGVEAWHCRKQKMFACIKFQIIGGSCFSPCKQTPE